MSAAVVVAATGDGQSASPDEGRRREGGRPAFDFGRGGGLGGRRKWRMDDGDDEAGRRWMMVRRAAQVDPLNAMGQVVEVDEIIRGARGTQKKKGRREGEGRERATQQERRTRQDPGADPPTRKLVRGQWEGVVYYYCKSSAGDRVDAGRAQEW